MMLRRILVFVGTAKWKLALILIAACTVFACDSPLPWGPKKIAPNDKISVTGLTAKIKHMESCWEGCRPYDEISFFSRFQKLGDDFFDKELGISYQPHTGGIIAFPRKAMLITTLADSNEGEIVAGLTVIDHQPRVRPLMGCMSGNRGPISSYPINDKYVCANGPNNLHYWSALYFEAAKVSYHYDYWIDYQTETFHEIAAQFPNDGKRIGVIGIDRSRNHFVLLFSSSNDKTYSLCAYGNAGLEATYRCVEFAADDPAPLANDPAETSPPKLPVATSGVRFAKVDMTLVAARLAWLSKYFSDPLSLDSRTSTQIVSSKSGVKPPPIEERHSPCGKCQASPEPSLVEWPPSPVRSAEQNRKALMPDFGSQH